jgi:hypothetical protein
VPTTLLGRVLGTLGFEKLAHLKMAEIYRSADFCVWIMFLHTTLNAAIAGAGNLWVGLRHNGRIIDPCLCHTCEIK